MYGSGTPIDIVDGNSLWRGTDRTNGFLMRSVDGRVPALTEGFSKLVMATNHALYTEGVVPWGNGLWLDRDIIATSPHTLKCARPTKSLFAGVLKFEQGWQTGNPVKNWGLPLYSRGTVIRNGLVGYKVAKVSNASVANYIGYLQGDPSKDINTIRSTYEDWVALFAGLTESTQGLGLFFELTTGFPIVMSYTLASPPASPVFAGKAKIFEPENQTIYFDINV
jgi:hypothetical protein